GLFVYTQKGSIISTVDLPTTEIIEPKKCDEKSWETNSFLVQRLKCNGFPLHFVHRVEFLRS
ncbi:hypothetical protein EI989_09350, partial [Streptococcus suis]